MAVAAYGCDSRRQRQAKNTGLVCSDVNAEGQVQAKSNWPFGVAEGYIKDDALDVNPESREA